MKHEPYEIIKTEITNYGVVIYLANGVVVNLSTNPSYIHLGFSGVNIPMKVGMGVPYSEEIPSLEVSNNVNIAYKAH